MDQARDPGDPPALVRVRESPPFFVTDDRLNVIFRSDDAVSDPSGLPPAIDVVARRLTKRLAVSNEASLLGFLSSSEVIRVARLDAGNGARHFAVVLERFAARSSLSRAAKRFALSRREKEVLAVLMRGEGTPTIARSLRIGTSTVNEHLRRIGQKMHVTRRSEIIATVFKLR
jgi:DNA-binding CsgD family transcriptional regulator